MRSNMCEWEVVVVYFGFLVLVLGATEALVPWRLPALGLVRRGSLIVYLTLTAVEAATVCQPIELKGLWLAALVSLVTFAVLATWDALPMILKHV